jgi:hypothetical protein
MLTVFVFAAVISKNVYGPSIFFSDLSVTGTENVNLSQNFLFAQLNGDMGPDALF